MAVLRVPGRHSKVVAELTEFSADTVDILVTAINNSNGSAVAVRRLLDELVSDGALAYDSLISINVARLSLQISAAEAYAQIVESLDEYGSADLVPLLENQVVIRLAKRVDLLSAYERGLHTFRLFTDIRPIFNEFVDEAIEAVLITNTLQLMFHQDGELREIYLRADVEDLKAMLQQAERALAKVKTAEKFAASSGASVIVDESEDTE